MAPGKDGFATALLLRVVASVQPLTSICSYLSVWGSWQPNRFETPPLLFLNLERMPHQEQLRPDGCHDILIRSRASTKGVHTIVRQDGLHKLVPSVRPLNPSSDPRRSGLTRSMGCEISYDGSGWIP